jgi:transposase InsO family protein
MIVPVVRELAGDGIPVATACRVLQVLTSGFYEWDHRPASARAWDQAHLMHAIRQAHAASYGTCGHRRVHAELVLGQRLAVSHGRVERLMRCAGLQGVHRRRLRGCTRRDQAAVSSEDLVERSFRPAAPDRLYVADITQHRTSEGWFYLAVVLDCFSRRVVGWAMADHIRSELVVDALQMAIWNRRPAPGAIHHSDHGTYTSWAFGHRLREAGLLASMGSIGDSTTRSRRASSRPCRPSCSTAAPGRPARAWPRPRSRSSRASTTRAGGTPPSATSAPPTSSSSTRLDATPRPPHDAGHHTRTVRAGGATSRRFWAPWGVEDEELGLRVAQQSH